MTEYNEENMSYVVVGRDVSSGTAVVSFSCLKAGVS
jgi:hypothetical protein